MQLNKKTACIVLDMIAGFPGEVLMRPTIHECRPGTLAKYIRPYLYEGLSAEETLTHLHILSQSGLVFPETNIEDLQKLLDESNTDNRDKYNDDGYYETRNIELWEKSIPGLLAKFCLTVQGYEWLEKYRDQV
jgi:hypothetical protein